MGAADCSAKGPLAFAALALALFVGGSGSARAQEGTHYTPGIFNIQDFAPAPPGVYAQNFLLYYATDEFRDRDGDKVRSIDPGTGPVPVDIDVDTWASFFALYWITDIQILGASYGIVAGIPLQNVDVTASLPTLGVRADESSFGLGDLMFQPVYLGWRRDRWEASLGYLFYAPTGRYDEDETDNLGLGYWTHELQASVVYRAGEDGLWTLGSMLTYDIHSRRSGVRIRPGDTFTVEWGVSRILAPWQIELGLTGYSQLQVTDDSGSGVVRDRDIHDEVHALGVQTSWTSSSRKWNLAFRYLKEIYAEDRFRGDLAVFTITHGF